MDPITITFIVTTFASLIVNIVQAILAKAPKCNSNCMFCVDETDVIHDEHDIKTK